MSRFTRAASLLLALFLLFPAAALADQAKKLYDQGKAAEARENYEAAYDLYSKAFELKPLDLRYKAAVTRLRFLAGASYVHRGQKLRDEGKLEDALVLFEKAYLIDPSSDIARQEIRKTKAMLDAAKGGAAAKPPSMSPIRKRLEEAQEPVELVPISNVPITLKLTEDSKVIYQTIGKLAGLNVLFDPDYTSRRISVELNGVTLDQALEVVALESKTFWRPVTPNTLFVASDTLAKRKELEQNVIKTFYLTNVSLPTELQDMVNAIRSILEVSRIQQLPTQKAIVVRGTPDQVALAEKLITDIDKAKPEVIIDVVVMQVTHDLIRDLGIAPPASGTVALQGTTTTTSTTTTGTTTGATATTVPNTITMNQFANLTANNFLVTIPPATANFVFTNANTKIIQSPRVRASDGQKASLKIGDRVPVATGSFQPGIGGVGINPLVNTQFQYIDVGVNVDITPQVHANREVSMKVTIDVSAVTSQVNIGGIQQPVIGQRKIEHEVRLKEGEVNLMGGILESQDIKSWAGIPGLGQIPLLRYLFASEHTEKHENEIVFALIPHIVRGPELTALNEKALDVGTGTSIELRRKIESPGGGSPQGTVFQPRTAQPQPVSAVQAQNPPAAAPASQPVMPQSPAPAPAPQPPSASLPTTPPGPIAFTFDPPTLSQATGSTFPLNVMLSGGQDVFSVPLQISYDPKLLQLVNVSNGSFLSQDGQPVALVHRDDSTTGMLQVTATRPPSSGGASGQGTVLTLTFLAKAPGQGTVAITRPGARNSSGQVIPASGGQASVAIH
jgi:general secretion pathway protein D